MSDFKEKYVQILVLLIKALFAVIDFVFQPFYFILGNHWDYMREPRQPKAEIVLRDEKSITYRSLTPRSVKHQQLLDKKIDTLEKLFEYVTRKYASKRCLGTRIVLEEREEISGDKVLQKYNLGEYRWITYREANSHAANFGRGLRKLGQEPYSKVAILAETRAEWMIAAHGCFKEAMVIVTVYSTLGEDGIAHCLNETEVTTVITSHDLLPLLKRILEQCPHVALIVYMEDQLAKADLNGFQPHVAVIPYEQVLTLGKGVSFYKVYPKSTDVAIIMYTSGSTGTPKGVLLAHSNGIATIKGVADVLDFTISDIFLGYLPLAHVFEFLSENFALLTGMAIGYSSPSTITSNSFKVMKGCEGDAVILRPTIMTSVPLVLDRIVKAINDKIATLPPLKRALISSCYDYRLKWLRRGSNTPILNRLIFKKIKQILGGRMQLIISGGAPLTRSTHEQIETFLCVKLIQGYGLTETTSGATVMDKTDIYKERIGPPLTVCDLRLINWEDNNYRITDKPYPRGEILIGGETVALGYFKMPASDDFFEADGKRWFKTGDIGQIFPDGVCKIIDRKKDILKLQSGEYISLGKIEAIFRTLPQIDNVCVYGESTQNFLVALIVPNKENFMSFVSEKLDINGLSFEECCKNTDVIQLMTKEITDYAQKHHFHKSEIPNRITLIPDQWLPGSNLVTAAFKLKRKEIKEAYKHHIQRMYKL